MTRAEAAEATGSVLRTQRTELVLLLLVGIQFMVSLDATIVFIALPSVQDDLGFSTASLAWVIFGYALPFGGLLLLFARLADLLGRRRMLLIGITVFSVASLLCGFAHGPEQLIAARALQGIGAAIMSPVAMTLLLLAFHGPARHRALGWWGAMSGVAGGSGMLLGGVLSTASWRWNFLVNVPIGVLFALLAARLLAETRQDSAAQPDILGALLATSGLSLVVYVTVQTETAGWLAWSTAGALALALLLLVAFVIVERKASNPLTPLRIFTNPNVSAGNVIIALVGAIGQIGFFTLTLSLQHVHGYSPLIAGAAFLPISVAIFLASTRVAPVIRRLGLKGALAGGLGLAVVGQLWLAYTPPEATYARGLFLATIVWGLGFGLAQAASFIAGARGVAQDLASVASGLIATTYRIGGAIGLAALSTLAAAKTTAAAGNGPITTAALSAGHSWAFLGGAVLAVAGIALCPLLSTS